MVTKAINQAVRVVRVRFDNAASVYLMGKFNNWSNLATPLTYIGNRLWEVTLPAEADLREIGFFVWQKGQQFGHFLRHDEEGPTPQLT